MSEDQNKPDGWEEQLKRIIDLGARIDAWRGGRPLPPPEEIIRQMREERAEQIEQAVGPWRSGPDVAAAETS